MLFEALDREMEQAPAIVQASEFWQNLNRLHRQRLAASGIANFKRTAATDYFTWLRVLPWDSQIRFLVRNLPLGETLGTMVGAFRPLKHEHIPLTEGLALNRLTRLLWRYAEREAGDQLGSQLSQLSQLRQRRVASDRHQRNLCLEIRTIALPRRLHSRTNPSDGEQLNTLSRKPAPPYHSGLWLKPVSY